jgi:ribosomal protein L12E/L44/L45/RPP1/RPP2
MDRLKYAALARCAHASQLQAGARAAGAGAGAAGQQEQQQQQQQQQQEEEQEKSVFRFFVDLFVLVFRRDFFVVF